MEKKHLLAKLFFAALAVRVFLPSLGLAQGFTFRCDKPEGAHMSGDYEFHIDYSKKEGYKFSAFDGRPIPHKGSPGRPLTAKEIAAILQDSSAREQIKSHQKSIKTHPQFKHLNHILYNEVVEIEANLARQKPLSKSLGKKLVEMLANQGAAKVGVKVLVGACAVAMSSAMSYLEAAEMSSCSAADSTLDGYAREKITKAQGAYQAAILLFDVRIELAVARCRFNNWRSARYLDPTCRSRGESRLLQPVQRLEARVKELEKVIDENLAWFGMPWSTDKKVCVLDKEWYELAEGAYTLRNFPQADVDAAMCSPSRPITTTSCNVARPTCPLDPSIDRDWCPDSQTSSEPEKPDFVFSTVTGSPVGRCPTGGKCYATQGSCPYDPSQKPENLSAQCEPQIKKLREEAANRGATVSPAPAPGSGDDLAVTIKEESGELVGCNIPSQSIRDHFPEVITVSSYQCRLSKDGQAVLYLASKKRTTNGVKTASWSRKVSGDDGNTYDEMRCVAFGFRKEVVDENYGLCGGYPFSRPVLVSSTQESGGSVVINLRPSSSWGGDAPVVTSVKTKVQTTTYSSPTCTEACFVKPFKPTVSYKPTEYGQLGGAGWPFWFWYEGTP